MIITIMITTGTIKKIIIIMLTCFQQFIMLNKYKTQKKHYHSFFCFFNWTANEMNTKYWYNRFIISNNFYIILSSDKRSVISLNAIDVNTQALLQSADSM